jgi:hypothetical protein
MWGLQAMSECPPGEHKRTNPWTCVKCGRAVPRNRPRNLDLERQLTSDAAMHAGYMIDEGGRTVGDDGSLSAWAEHRAWPGGVRPHMDEVQEVREELADARNYLVWGCERIHDRFLAGDPLAADEYARNMNALSLIIKAWHALRV